VDIEITEVRDLDGEWPALALLFRGLHEHHLLLMDATLREDWEARQKAGIEDQLRTGDVVILVATDGGQPIGLAHAHVAEHPIIEDRTGFVDNAYVRPSARRQGVLSTMLERIEDWFKAKGAHSAQLNVVAGNKEATVAWRAKGYKPYMERMPKELD
jgi:GNAT superfamily N-acetyltransferase